MEEKDRKERHFKNGAYKEEGWYKKKKRSEVSQKNGHLGRGSGASGQNEIIQKWDIRS